MPLPPSWRAPAGGTGYEDRLARCGPTEIVVSAVVNIHHGAYQAHDLALASPLAIVEADRRLRSAAEAGIQ